MGHTSPCTCCSVPEHQSIDRTWGGRTLPEPAACCRRCSCYTPPRRSLCPACRSKRALLLHLQTTRQRLQRLHVCAQWAHKAKAVNTCREVLKAAADHGAAFVHAGVFSAGAVGCAWHSTGREAC